MIWWANRRYTFARTSWLILNHIRLRLRQINVIGTAWVWELNSFAKILLIERVIDWKNRTEWAIWSQAELRIVSKNPGWSTIVPNPHSLSNIHSITIIVVTSTNNLSILKAWIRQRNHIIYTDRIWRWLNSTLHVF